MGKRRRRGSGGAPRRAERRPAATSDYRDHDGNVLTLRDELTEGTLRAVAKLEARPGASAEDRRQRRTELVFEHLAVGWEIAGLPIRSQKELLGRYRMASAAERKWVRGVLVEHLSSRYPQLEL